MSYWRIALPCIVLPLIGFQPATVRSEANSHVSSAVVSIDVSADEWLGGYLEWMHRHSAATIPAPHTPSLNNQTSQSAQASSSKALPDLGNAAPPPPPPVMLRMPYLELYSLSGDSLYHGTDAEQNAAFLRALPHSIPTKSVEDTQVLRPTLLEYLDMSPKFKPYMARIRARKTTTVFAVSFPDKPFCKPQNEALQQFKTRADGIHIRVIEVRLHS